MVHSSSRETRRKRLTWWNREMRGGCRGWTAARVAPAWVACVPASDIEAAVSAIRRGGLISRSAGDIPATNVPHVGRLQRRRRGRALDAGPRDQTVRLEVERNRRHLLREDLHELHLDLRALVAIEG